jgi:NTP pyrophosphatase (non-canonical NTP hydrolase)
MTLNDYQDRARETAAYPNQLCGYGLNYCVALANEEAGELAGVWAKALRQRNIDMYTGAGLTELDLARFEEEAGDMLWALANLAEELGTTLNMIATKNLAKLAKRQQAGTIKGGDR